MATVVHMNKFPCDGCWTMAVARARSNDGRVDLWYEAYHKEMHAKGEPEVCSVGRGRA